MVNRKPLTRPTGLVKVWFLISSLWPTKEHRDWVRRTRSDDAARRRCNSQMMKFVRLHEGGADFLARADAECARLVAELGPDPPWTGGDYIRRRQDEQVVRAERWRARVARFGLSIADEPDFEERLTAERYRVWALLELDGEPEECGIRPA